jgi:lysophospholipase L1-like esterase
VHSRRIITLVVLFACGQTTAMGDRAEHAEQARVPVVIRTSQHADEANDAGSSSEIATSTSLDNAAALKRFFEALAALDDGTATGDVRIVQFGDSHTAADMLTGTARRALQTRFGDGGRGFVAIGKPWRSYWQEGVHSPGSTRDWHTLSLLGKIDHGKWVFGDGCYGLGGVCMVTNHPGARAWSEISSPTSTIEIDYWEQPSGGTFDVTIDGTSTTTVSTRGATQVSAFKSIDVPDGPHKIELRTHGDGDVRLFGMTLDRAQVGVVYDALGINGARAAHVSKSNEAHFDEQLRHRAPALVVLAYGTNESADERPLQDVEHEIQGAIGRVLRAAPTASCLLLGPPDRAIPVPSDNPYTDGKDAGSVWETAPRLEQIVDIERRLAGAAGCAFFDQFAAMGGAGSIEAWAEADPPRAQHDRVHLTRDGYVFVGTRFATDLLTAYGAWRVERGLAPKTPPVVAPPPANPIPQQRQDDDMKPNANANTTSAPFVAIPL